MSELQEALGAAGAGDSGKGLAEALRSAGPGDSKRYLAHHMSMRGGQTIRNMYGAFDTVDEVLDSTDRAIDEEPPDVAVMQRVTDTETNHVVARTNTSREWRLVFSP